MPVSVPTTVDASAALGAVVAVVVGSILVAWLEDKLRFAVWSVFDIVATPFSFAARGLLQLADFLSHLIDQGSKGLSDEGKKYGEESTFWVGWYIIGPVVYFGLFLIFISSDFSIAYLVFEAFGLIASSSRGLPAGLPLETAVALLFVALGAFWGLLYFDLLQATPFSYIWSSLEARLRKGLMGVSMAMFGLTLLAALLMGIWRQWQLALGDPPEPWNSIIPPAVSGILTVLVVAATGFSGKPVGSGSAALWVTALLLTRASAHVFIVVLRLLVTVIRRVMQIPFAAIGVPAYFGAGVWNWIRSYPSLQARLHLAAIGPLASLDEPGGDLDAPVLADHRQKPVVEMPAPASVRPAPAPVDLAEERRAPTNGLPLPPAARRTRAARGGDSWGTRGGIPV